MRMDVKNGVMHRPGQDSDVSIHMTALIPYIRINSLIVIGPNRTV